MTAYFSAKLPVILLLALFGFTAVDASARTTRPYEESFGPVKGAAGKLAVDQANGDVYVSHGSTISRFSASGAPKNFTEGPGAGGNSISLGQLGLLHLPRIAIDNSGGPLDGTVYVTSHEGVASAPKQVKAFSRSGKELGSITGSTTPTQLQKFGSTCGVAVDQSNGDLYVTEPSGHTSSPRVYRYRPSSPSGAIDDSDYHLTGVTSTGNCDIGTDSTTVYTATNAGQLRRMDASEFSKDFPDPEITTLEEGGGVTTGLAVDPKNGDLYVNRGHEVTVFDSKGNTLYSFGAAAYSSNSSEGVAVVAAASGSATKAYVSDPKAGGQIDVFGLPTQSPFYTYPSVTSFGSDGSPGTSFGSGFVLRAAFHQASRSLYLSDPDPESPVIWGFDSSTPPTYSLLSLFDPLPAAKLSFGHDLAVDNTGLASAGNLYLASDSTDLIYGFDSTGKPLGESFPVDPAVSHGSPEGSPKNLCGVAVDSTGNLWVANESTSRILKYDSSGAALPGTVDVSAQGKPCSLAFSATDDLYVSTNTGVWKHTAASGYTSVSRVGNSRADRTQALAVDPATQRLYVAENSGCGTFQCNISNWIDEYNAEGELIGEFAYGSSGFLTAVAVDGSNHFVYASDASALGRVRVFSPGILLPEARLSAASEVTNTAGELHGRVSSQGVALDGCDFEYVSEAAYFASGFTDLSSGGSIPCDPAAGSVPSDLSEHPVAAPVDGLERNATYRFRLVVSNANGTTETDVGSLTTTGPPEVETTGTSLRASGNAQLLGRVYPVRAETTYHFEYGSQGPCDANPCTPTPDRPAGSGDQFRLVAEEVTDLNPSTTYHYRLVASNGNPEGSSVGQNMTVTTRSSDTPLASDDRFNGPPRSDRAYELVSMPETSGNPVIGGTAFANNGDRVLYQVAGGTPISDTGSFQGIYDSHRVETGLHQGSWQSKLITPPRVELIGSSWSPVRGAADLSAMTASNYSASGTIGQSAIWGLTPDGEPKRLFEPVAGQELAGAEGGYFGVSGDGKEVIAHLKGGSLDPDFPAAADVPNLYAVGSGPPELVSLLPGGAEALCGALGAKSGAPTQGARWVSGGGSLVFFASRIGTPCNEDSPPALYLRDLEAGETRSISNPLSGLQCGATLVHVVPGSAFFTTASRLVAEDADLSCAKGNDVYRYDIADDSLECLTCFMPGRSTEVTGKNREHIAVADDGSRLYFSTAVHLLPGTPPEGQPGSYRLDVESGDLAYVGPLPSSAIGAAGIELTADGSQLIFATSSSAMNPLGGGSDNAQTRQFYLYDDRDRSIVCVSCPLDGSQPTGGVSGELGQGLNGGRPGRSRLSENGIFAFNTPTALVADDQNTPDDGSDPQIGQDVYEWRDGRQLLISDGLTSWFASEGLSSAPSVQAVSPSGRDVFFTAWDQLTSDAPDAFNRLYDARIGGGFEFPPVPPPCPLEVCQGTPKGAPERASLGSGTFAGAGNVRGESRPRCRKGKVRRKGRCVAKRKRAKHRKRQRSTHSRRTGR